MGEAAFANLPVAPSTPVKGAPIVVASPKEEIKIQVPQPVPMVAKPGRVVIEKVIHEKSLGLTFREVEGMLSKLRSSMVLEFDARIKQEPRDIPSDLPAVGPLLLEHQEKLRADFDELRSGLLQEVTAKLQQTCALLLPEMHAIVQKTHAEIAEEVQALIQNERSYVFTTMKDLVQQQLTTLSDSTNGEFSRMQALITAGSTACDERLERLECSCAACNSSLAELKEEFDKASHHERIADLDSKHTAMSDMGDIHLRVTGLDSDLSGHIKNLAKMAKVHDAVGDLQKDLMTTRASLSNVVQNDHLARHKEEHASSLANLSQSLESAWTLSKEELTELMLGEREAREILEEAVVAVGQETRNLKENFARLDKLSEELSGEVGLFAAAMRRSPAKRPTDRQSLDRYRDILAHREAP